MYESKIGTTFALENCIPSCKLKYITADRVTPRVGAEMSLWTNLRTLLFCCRFNCKLLFGCLITQSRSLHTTSDKSSVGKFKQWRATYMYILQSVLESAKQKARKNAQTSRTVYKVFRGQFEEHQSPAVSFFSHRLQLKMFFKLAFIALALLFLVLVQASPAAERVPNSDETVRSGGYHRGYGYHGKKRGYGYGKYKYGYGYGYGYKPKRKRGHKGYWWCPYNCPLL